MQTINGKLVLRDLNHSEHISLQMESFTQQLEKIELQMATVQQQDRKECINQLKILKASVQNLERSYSQLLFTTIVTTVIVAFLLLLFSVMRQPSCNKTQINNSMFAWNNQSFIN